MKETALEHIEGSKRFTISCGEAWSCKLIRKLQADYPDEVEVVYENTDGSFVARVPMKWVKVAPPRKLNLSDERRAALSEQGKRLAEMRHGQP